MRLLLVVLVACASAKPVPAADPTLKWKQIIANEMRVPEGTTVAALLPELIDFLGSTDPVRRDQIAFEVLDFWLRRAKIVDADLDALVAKLIDNMKTGDNVFRRSFSVLVLSRVMFNTHVTDAQARTILAAAVDYAGRETDLRGYTGANGWAHAAAHTGDLLSGLVKVDTFGDAERQLILDAVAKLVVRKHGTILCYGEDGRLGSAILGAIKRGVPPIDPWIKTIMAPLQEKMADFDAGIYAAQRNARNLLFTLYVQAELQSHPTDNEKKFVEALKLALQ